MLKTLKILGLWLVIYGFIWVVYRTMIGYDHHLISVIYFSLLSILSLQAFRDIFKKLVKKTTKKNYLVLLLFLALHFTTYWICNNYLEKPVEFIKNNPASFTLVDKYFLLIKPLDVLFQQIMIVILVKKLQENKISLNKIILIMMVVFGVAHLYSTTHMELVPTLIMTFFTLILSIVFPYFILKVKSGYLYSFISHLVFVDLAALMFWLVF